MSENHKSPIESLLDKLGVALATLLAGAIVYLLTCLGRPIVDAIAAASTKEFLLRLSVLLAVALLVALSWIFWLRSQLKKPLSSKFDFEIDGGYYIDRKTRVPVCARCLAEGVVLHLQQHAPTIFRCTACKTTYVNVRLQREAQTPNTALEPTGIAP